MKNVLDQENIHNKILILVNILKKDGGKYQNFIEK